MSKSRECLGTDVWLSNVVSGRFDIDRDEARQLAAQVLRMRGVLLDCRNNFSNLAGGLHGIAPPTWLAEAYMAMIREIDAVLKGDARG